MNKRELAFSTVDSNYNVIHAETVQFIDENGNTINVKGRQTKGGTYEFATGQIGPNGNEIYASISSQATVPGFGTVNDFFDKTFLAKALGKFSLI